MKKRFGIYSAFWAILLALFNVIAFVSVGWIGQEKYTASFWIGYSLITVMFIGQLICSYLAFKADNSKKLFYNVSLIRTSYAGLIVSFIVGGLCMLISPLPYWIGILVCAIVLAANALSLIKATAAVSEISRVDDKIKTQTIFIKVLSAEASTLLTRAASDPLKAECKKIYDAIRYSDPISHPLLAEIEEEIQRTFREFEKAVISEDNDLAVSISKDLIYLIEKRNNKCALAK